MKAIRTKYLGPTDKRGSRIKAYDEDKNNIVLPYDHALNSYDNHVKAAEGLKTQMKWTGRLIAGSWKNGYVFVFLE